MILVGGIARIGEVFGFGRGGAGETDDDGLIGEGGGRDDVECG